MTTRRDNPDKYRLVPNIVGKRDSFGKLITALYKLGATAYLHVPTMSNPYSVIEVRSIMKGSYRDES
jgi:hypothetical protein